MDRSNNQRNKNRSGTPVKNINGMDKTYKFQYEKNNIPKVKNSLLSLQKIVKNLKKKK